ncbi:MAG: hypothetical protein ABI839_01360 [Verrucomicrobiota bacterium]
MKRTLTLATAIALSTFALAKAQPPPGGHHHGGMMHHNPLEEMTQSLNLTPDQQAKVTPVLDQAKPQLRAIHEDAMTKAKAVIENSLAQIRPLLTPEQQTKLDAQVKAHMDMMNAAKELHEAKEQ